MYTAATKKISRFDVIPNMFLDVETVNIVISFLICRTQPCKRKSTFPNFYYILSKRWLPLFFGTPSHSK